MSMWRVVLFPVLLVAGVACTTDGPTPANEPQQSSMDQEIGLPPSCPSGQSVIYWDEEYGTCNGCRRNGVAGQPSHQYAACSGNIPGTKRLIQNLCTTPCELQ